MEQVNECVKYILETRIGSLPRTVTLSGFCGDGKQELARLDVRAEKKGNGMLLTTIIWNGHNVDTLLVDDERSIQNIFKVYSDCIMNVKDVDRIAIGICD